MNLREEIGCFYKGETESSLHIWLLWIEVWGLAAGRESLPPPGPGHVLLLRSLYHSKTRCHRCGVGGAFPYLPSAPGLPPYPSVKTLWERENTVADAVGHRPGILFNQTETNLKNYMLHLSVDAHFPRPKKLLASLMDGWGGRKAGKKFTWVRLY